MFLIISGPGKPVGLAVNCSKHILAELKADHVRRNCCKVKQKQVPAAQAIPEIRTPEWTCSVLETLATKPSTSPSRQQAQEAVPALEDDPAVEDHAPSASSVGNQLLLLDSQIAEYDEARQAGRKRKRAPTWQACVNEIEKLAQGPEADAPHPHRQRVNGWTVHLHRFWATMPQLHGETKASRKARVFRQARLSWNAAWLFESYS